MRVSKINTKEFLSALALASKFIDSRTKMKALTGIVLTADRKRGLIIQATDLTNSFEGTVACEVEAEGKTAINYKEFVAALKLLRASDTIGLLAMGENQIAIATSANTRLMTTMTEPLDVQFPNKGETRCIEMKTAATFADMLDKASPAANEEHERMAFHGVLVQQNEDSIIAVASDGHRLHIVDRPLETLGYNPNAIIPKESCKIISDTMRKSKQERFASCVVNDRLFIYCLTFEMSFALITADFPEYTKAIPTDGDKIATVINRPFDAALSMVAPSDQNGIVSMTFKPNAKSAIHTATSESLIDVQFDHDDEFSIPIQAQYLRDFIGANESIETELRMHAPKPTPYKDPQSGQMKERLLAQPILAISKDDPGFFAVIMPVY
jgi:DNA polymerase-3 subunit beta